MLAEGFHETPPMLCQGHLPTLKGLLALSEGKGGDEEARALPYLA